MSACPRFFEAEALRDGRLTGAERASFEGHLSRCDACSREVRALDELGRALRDAPSSEPDDVQARRERVRLLAAFDGELVAPEQRAFPRAVVGSAAAFAVLVACVFAFRFWRAPPPARAASASVRADGEASWSKSVDGNHEKVVLERGTLSIHVEHSPERGPLVVSLPDGTLEDVGTTFTVAVEDGHTERVTVSEGRVVLRLRGAPPVSVGAGESWRSSAAPAPSANAAPSAPIAPLDSSTAPSAPVSPLDSSAARLEATPRTNALAPAASEASSAFRAAMDALGHGEYGRAATLLEGFLEKYPRDARAEDAAYSRVIALEKLGDATAMKREAALYLAHYPNGFRRAEVESLAH